MSKFILLDTKEERSGDKGEVLLAVAVFPPGGKKETDRGKGMKSQGGIELGIGQQRDGCQTGDTALL